MTSDLTVDTDPAEVGLDAARLERLDRRLARWVDDGQLPGFLVTVARHGHLVHVGRHGLRDVENGLPVEDDTRWRIFSMTKPVTSVAAMMLYEEGAFELNDPISKWLPEFAETRVYVAGSDHKPVTAPQIEPIRVRHLLTHTSGLTYGFHHAHPVDAMYRAMGHEWGTPPGADSAEVLPPVGVDAAGLPARQRVELRRLHRRPRPAGRGALRPAARRVLRAAHLRAARHARHVVRPARRRRPRLPGPALPRRRPGSPAARRPG